MLSTGVLEKIHREFEQARLARAGGLEGRARVCARRAAGFALREYLSDAPSLANANVYQLLQAFQQLSQIPDSARKNAERLVMRVDEAYHLPSEIDLLVESQQLVETINLLTE